MQSIATPVTRLMVLFLLLGLGGCSNKEREEGTARLTEQAAEQIQAAEQKMNEYDFDAAKKLLYELREEIQGSSYVDVATEDKLIADIDAAYAVLSDRKTDFFCKKGQGYSLVDGKLLSPAERKRILAENRRESEEQRRKEETRRAEKDERQRELQKRQERQRQESQQRQKRLRQERETKESQRKARLQTAIDNGALIVRTDEFTKKVTANTPEVALSSIDNKVEIDGREYTVPDNTKGQIYYFHTAAYINITSRSTGWRYLDMHFNGSKAELLIDGRYRELTGTASGDISGGTVMEHLWFKVDADLLREISSARTVKLRLSVYSWTLPKEFQDHCRLMIDYAGW